MAHGNIIESTSEGDSFDPECYYHSFSRMSTSDVAEYTKRLINDYGHLTYVSEDRLREASEIFQDEEASIFNKQVSLEKIAKSFSSVESKLSTEKKINFYSDFPDLFRNGKYLGENGENGNR